MNDSEAALAPKRWQSSRLAPENARAHRRDGHFGQAGRGHLAVRSTEEYNRVGKRKHGKDCRY